MNILKNVVNRIAESDKKTELKSEKVELFRVDDTIKLYNEGLKKISEADKLKQKLRSAYSEALIILQANVPAQLDDSIKKLIDLGINDKANELKSLKQKSLKTASEYKKLYDSLK